MLEKMLERYVGNWRYTRDRYDLKNERWCEAIREERTYSEIERVQQNQVWRMKQNQQTDWIFVAKGANGFKVKKGYEEGYGEYDANANKINFYWPDKGVKERWYFPSNQVCFSWSSREVNARMVLISFLWGYKKKA